MTERVDFYVLKSTAARERWAFACRLTEKAYMRDLSVVIVNDTLADAQALDDLLWTFNERSFIPHKVCADEHSMDPAAKVHLTALSPAPAASPAGSAALPTVPAADLLVNLTARLPAHWERYPRIAEIIDADDERRRLGRERFKTYRDLKVTLETHQFDETADI
jgi:DNA polymerase-3 subunit chi